MVYTKIRKKKEKQDYGDDVSLSTNGELFYLNKIDIAVSAELGSEREDW